MGTDHLGKGQLPGQACLLLYDGECRFCVSIKGRLSQLGIGRAGSGVRFIPYQSEEAKIALGRDYRPGRPDRAFLVQPSGGILQGLDAFLPLVHHLPGGKSLLWWLRFHFVRRLVDWSYRMLARHRYRLFGESKFPVDKTDGS